MSFTFQMLAWTIFSILCLPNLFVAYQHYELISGSRRFRLNHIFCTDKQFQPLHPPTFDVDDTWRTKSTSIVPIELKPFPVKPQLITFDAFETLIEPSYSVGRWYREALNKACGMTIRLPRPALFSKAFKTAFNNMLV